MRPVWTVLLYVTGVFAAGALFAPWLYRITQALAPRASVFHDLAQQPFQRFVIRSILGLALLGLLPVARYSGIRSWREVGLCWERRKSLRELGAGAFVGFASLALIALFALLFGARNWNPTIANRHLEESILRALLAACAVAVLEEILFRGVLFGVLRRGHSSAFALAVSSGIYALVHFFRLSPWQEPLTWSSGVQILGHMVQGFVDPDALIPRFLVLFLAGMILALGFKNTNALWFSMGAHAGWIFWLKIYGVLTVQRSSQLVSFWGTTRLIDGWFAALVLVIPTILLLDWKQPKASNVPVG